MVRKFPEIIEFYSCDKTIRLRDIFTSGTPNGVAVERANRFWFLGPGDIMEAEVEGIGVFRNRMMSKKS